MPSKFTLLKYKFVIFWDKTKGNFNRLKNFFLKKKNHSYTLQSSLDQKLITKLSSSKLPSWQQLSHISQLLSPWEKRVIKFLSFLIVASLAVLGFGFYNQHISIVPTQGGEYTEGVVGAPHYLNPLLSPANDTDADLVSLIYSGLLRYNPQENAWEPDLCQKYTVDNNGKTYTFYLRDNLLWQDGEKITADDVVFTFELAKYPLLNSPLLPFVNDLKIEKINDFTVKVTAESSLKKKEQIFSVGILPKHIWENVNINNIALAEYNLKPIGSGPFQVDSFVRDKEGNIKSYTLIPNPNYYLQKPFLAKVTFVFLDSPEEIKNYLHSRSIQGAGFLANYDQSLRERFQSFSLPLAQYIGLFFNQTNNKFLKDKNIRLALRLSINKKELLKQTIKTGKIINSPALPLEQGEPSLFDPDQAQKLIEKSKWIKDENGFFYQEKKEGKEKSKEYLQLKITTPDSEKYQKIAEKIKEFWEKIGIQTDIEAIDNSSLGNKIKEKDYEILLYGENLDYNLNLYPFWHSTQTDKGKPNLALFQNKEADKILEEMEKNLSFTDQEKLSQFQKIIEEEAPAIFLYQPVYYYLVDKNIKNVKISNIIIPSDRFWGITNWYIKTKKEFSW